MRRFFRVTACRDQSFRIAISDPVTIERAQQLVGRISQPILIGELVRTSGGFNALWSWHLKPETIQFALSLC